MAHLYTSLSGSTGGKGSGGGSGIPAGTTTVPVPSGANNGQVLTVQGGSAVWATPTPTSTATQFRGSVANAAALSTITNPQPGDVASTKDNGHLHVYSGSAWDDIGPAAGGTLPSPTSSNNGQVLQVVGGQPVWTALANLLPTVSAANNGQVLGVAGGVPAWQTPTKELPPYTTADAGKDLNVKADGTLEWSVDPSSLPSATTANNGQVLGVAGGVPAWQAPTKELPPYTTADAGKDLNVKADGTLEWSADAAVPVPSSANNGQTLQVVGGVPTWVNVPVPVATQFRGSVADASALSTISSPQPGDVASTKDNGHLHVYSGSTWDDIGPAAGGTLPAPTTANNGQVLQVVGGQPVWTALANLLPTASAANNGQVLGVAGGVPVWQAAPDPLPSQGGHQGQFLTTDGTTAKWDVVDPPPSFAAYDEKLGVTMWLVRTADGVPVEYPETDTQYRLVWRGPTPTENYKVQTQGVTNPVVGTSNNVVLIDYTNSVATLTGPWTLPTSEAGKRLFVNTFTGVIAFTVPILKKPLGVFHAVTPAPVNPAIGDRAIVGYPVPTYFPSGVLTGSLVVWDGAKWVADESSMRFPSIGEPGQHLSIDSSGSHMEWVDSIGKAQLKAAAAGANDWASFKAAIAAL
jgi:hypothetical protein